MEQDAGEKTSYAEASEVNFMTRVTNSSLPPPPPLLLSLLQ